MKENAFSVEETADETQGVAKIPRTDKIKLIKELNHKFNVYGTLNNKSGQNLEPVVGKSRFRPESSTSSPSLIIDQIFRANQRNRAMKGEKLDGQVEFNDANGNHFKGMYKNGIRVSGKMTYTKGNCEYEGSFLGQKFHGHGKLSYFDGRSIEGEWQEQVLVGNAIINYPNGDVYYGTVDSRLHRHGKGHLFLKNGNKYIGDFMNGSITGYGTYHQGTTFVEGHWMYGELVKEVKLDEMQQEEMTRKIQLLRTRSSDSNNGSTNQLIQSLISPIASNIRLISVNSATNKESTEKQTSNASIMDIFVKRVSLKPAHTK